MRNNDCFRAALATSTTSSNFVLLPGVVRACAACNFFPRCALGHQHTKGVRGVPRTQRTKPQGIACVGQYKPGVTRSGTAAAGPRRMDG